ncbi:MAG: hypothetical protein ACE5JS_18940, partial [Nitrospinota bacterium]
MKTKRAILSLLLASVCTLLFSNLAAAPKPADTRDLAKRVAKRVEPQLKGLGLYPEKPGKGLLQYRESGSYRKYWNAQGRFIYKSPKRIGTKEYPAWKSEWIRGQFNCRWVSTKPRKKTFPFQTGTIYVGRDWSPSDRQWRKKPPRVEKKNPYRSGGTISVDLQEVRPCTHLSKTVYKNFSGVSRSVYKAQSYFQIPGRVLVNTYQGQTHRYAGYAGGFFGPIIQVDWAERIGGWFIHKIKGDRDFQVRVNVSGGDRGVPEIPRMDEATFHRIMSLFARALLEELKEPVPGEPETPDVAEKKKIPPKPDDDETEPVEEDEVEELPDDGYWKWFAQYLRDREQRWQQVNAIRRELSKTAKEIQKLRAEWMDLQRLDLEAFKAAGILDELPAKLSPNILVQVTTQIKQLREQQRKSIEGGLEQIPAL